VFEQDGLRLLGHAREALIYCCLAVGTEEMREKLERDPTKLTPPSLLDDFDDAWKF
jgi:hypothetical protein